MWKYKKTAFAVLVCTILLFGYLSAVLAAPATPIFVHLPIVIKQEPPACVGGDYEIQGVTGSNGAVPFYGVWGYTRVWDPSVSAGSDYVNSVWIMKDGNNILELGWVERGGCSYLFPCLVYQRCL